MQLVKKTADKIDGTSAGDVSKLPHYPCFYTTNNKQTTKNKEQQKQNGISNTGTVHTKGTHNNDSLTPFAQYRKAALANCSLDVT